jgi:hypothetical protein
MNIAFVANGEVFHIQDTSVFFRSAEFEQYFSSTTTFIDSSKYPLVTTNYFYENGFFYDPEDVEKINPIQEQTPHEQYVKIAFIQNGKVISTTEFDSQNNFGIKMIAGLLSNPIFVDISSNPEVQEGWILSGSQFYPPQNG